MLRLNVDCRTRYPQPGPKLQSGDSPCLITFNDYEPPSPKRDSNFEERRYCPVSARSVDSVRKYVIGGLRDSWGDLKKCEVGNLS